VPAKSGNSPPKTGNSGGANSKRNQDVRRSLEKVAEVDEGREGTAHGNRKTPEKKKGSFF
jgi:hypothetical protein